MSIGPLSRSFLRGRTTEASQIDRLTEALEAMSIDSAEQLARSFLSDQNRFSVAWISPHADTNDASPKRPTDRFLSAASRISMKFGDFLFDAEQIKPALIESGATELAMTTGGARLVSRSETDRVYVVDGDEGANHQWDDSYPSIWHYIVWMVATTEPVTLKALLR